MADTNFSLLSQEEIDTLIEFLTDKTNNLESEVLSQESIDKLISMIQATSKRPSGNRTATGVVRAVSQVLDGVENWNIDYEVDSDDFVQIFATDGQKKEYITPKGYSCACFVDDCGSWGYSISPVQFVDIALVYHLKFTMDTYESLCKHFARKHFGSEDYEIDDFFFAPSKKLLSCYTAK